MTLPSSEPVFPIPPHVRLCRLSFFGFGFDPKTGDYKVVKLTRDSNKTVTPQVEVYSVKKGSWKLIVDSFPSDVGNIHDEVSIDDHDGHINWLFYKANYIQKVVLVFNLGVESFSQISLPDSVANIADLYINRLSVLDGKLCVVSWSERDDGKIEVWVMNEYGVAESWVKSNVLSKLELELKGEYIRPVGFTLNNKFLYYDLLKNLLGTYDQETDKVTHIRINDDPNYSPTTGFIQYVDSLVWYAAPTN